MASWSASVGSYGTLTATGSISDKNSSGQATFTGTITYTPIQTGAMIIYATRISFALSDGSWVRAQVSFPSGRGTRSLSISCTVTFDSPYGDSDINGYGILYDSAVYYDGTTITGPTTGPGQTLTAGGYVDPTPTMSPKTLSVSPTSQTMGSAVTVTESGGYYATVNDRQVLYNGSKIASYSVGSWSPSVSTFEQYCTSSNSVAVQLRAYCVASSGAQGSGFSNKVDLTLTLPSTYIPTCTSTYSILNAVNGSIVGGKSGLSITLSPGLTPADNTATISSVELINVNPIPSTDTIPISESNFTNSGYVYTCSTLPIKANVPSYSFKMIFRIKDSRGNILDYESGIFRVSNFVPPLVNITNLNRTSATTGTLNISINGESSTNPSRIDNSVNTQASVVVSDGTTSVTYDVKSSLTETTLGYTLSYTIPNLASGSQYNVTFLYRDTTMYSYNETAYSYTQLLSTLGMPISLYDDGTNRFISFGEECQDSYTGATSTTVVNFSSGSEIRASNSVSSIIKSSYDVVNVPTRLNGLSFIALSESDYEDLTTKDANTIYFVYED